MDKQKIHDFVATGLPSCRILVVGDVMLDKYFYGEVTRISPEAPVPITHVLSSKETLGGAANVAHNLALLGCATDISGFVGEDYHCQSLLDKFDERGISHKGLVRTGRPTTTKLRIIGGHQQMMRLDFEEAEPVVGSEAAKLHDYVRRALSDGVDAIIISDYGKGCCTPETCQQIIAAAHEQNVPVVIDPKGSDWNKYAGADYITPNLKEINEILPERIKNEDAAVEKAAHYAMEKYQLKNIIVTRSENGMTLVTNESITHIPTKAQEVYDVSGAGDTVIAVFTAGIAGGILPVESARMANLAASVVVAKLGTYAVSKEELLEVL